jgi:diguanylate cyclase (GGDEF)-like protein
MKKTESQNLLINNPANSGLIYLFLGISLAALIATFLVANSAINFPIKASVFVLIIFAYVFLFWFYYPKQSAEQMDYPEENIEIEDSEIHFTEDIDNKLLALEEVSQFFGASLKPNDMFRLITSRINEMIPFASCALFLADENQTNLKIVFSGGENSEILTNSEFPSSKGLAGKAFISGRCQIDKQNLSNKEVFSPDALSGLKSAIAAPLYRGSDVFGVLELFGNEEKTFGESSLKLLEAIGERFAPLVSSSLAFEKNLSNALTDSLTNLPNERAFYLVLENQIAESQRYRDERPLTVLTIDIKNFTEINQKFGHSTGDNILFFASEIIKNQLRKMDFLARSMSDEFLTVLPTATEEKAQEIMERLNKILETSPYNVSPENKIIVQLNYGSATFWKDGETPNELLKVAHLRKQQNKSSDNPNLLRFPKSK